MLARLANHYCSNDLGIVPTVYLNNFDCFIDKFIDDRIEVKDPFLNHDFVHLSRKMSILQLLKKIFSLFIFLVHFCFKFYQLLRKKKIDVVHVNGITCLIISAIPIKLAGKKLVFHMHDALLSSQEGGNIELLGQHGLLFFMRFFADTVIVLSDFVGNSIIRKCQFMSSKIHRVYNGIDIKKNNTERLADKRKIIDVISFGRVIREKGFHLGIMAVSILKHRYGKNVKYQIVGDGAQLDELKQLARKTGVQDLVSFKGFQDQPENYIVQAVCVLVPSIWQEPFGLCIIESWAKQKAVIATAVGAIPEIIEDGVNGFLVPIENAAENIAKKILLILENPSLRETIEKKAFQTLYERFAIDRMANEITSLYCSMD